MNFHTIKVPYLGDILNTIPPIPKIDLNFHMIYTLDEYGNIYLAGYDKKPGVLWNYRPGSVWERREFKFYPGMKFIHLICVRKERLYAVCPLSCCSWCLVVIDLTINPNEAKELLILKNEHYEWLAFYEIWEDELRFYKYKTKKGEKYSIKELTGYDVLCLTDSKWSEGKINLLKFGVVLDDNFDYHICLRDQGKTLYVCRAYGVKRYNSDGSSYWIYENSSYLNVEKNWDPDMFLQVGDYFCFIEDKNLVLLSEPLDKKTANVTKIQCSFKTRNIASVMNRLYLFKYDRNGHLRVDYLNLQCLTLKEITFYKVAQCLKAETTYEELYSKIRNLAKLFNVLKSE